MSDPELDWIQKDDADVDFESARELADKQRAPRAYVLHRRLCGMRRNLTSIVLVTVFITIPLAIAFQDKFFVPVAMFAIGVMVFLRLGIEVLRFAIVALFFARYSLAHVMGTVITMNALFAGLYRSSEDQGWILGIGLLALVLFVIRFIINQAPGNEIEVPKFARDIEAKRKD